MNPSMQENYANIIIVTEIEFIYWEVGLVGQKTGREKFGYVFSFEGFCGEKQFGNN
jgi:hypothetical protein